MAPTAPRVSRGILEDRYAGAIDVLGQYTEIGLKLANLVNDLVIEVARRDDDRALSGTGGVEEAVMAAIHETVVGEIDKRGLAR